MTRYSFLDDYSEGGHPAILEALTRTNLEQHAPYGTDTVSEEAREMLRDAVGDSGAGVHFVASGTLANLVSISAYLRPHEAVIAPQTGHIASREAGSIEATGHKIITMPTDDGRLTPDLVTDALAANAHAPHMAKPRMVYVSNATETGTRYSKAQLEALSETCRSKGLLLFLDGARLAAALAAEGNDLTLQDVYHLTDVFWLGGTKAGALFGEAIVIRDRSMAEEFPFHLKQRGALLAKGRMLGIQFRELLRDGKFLELAGHANHLASRLSKGVLTAGYDLAAPTETNQVFAVLPDRVIATLQNNFDFFVWESVGGERSVVRLVTSWATPQEAVDRFIAAVAEA